MATCETYIQNPKIHADTCTLDYAKEGDYVKIVDILCGSCLERRLCSLGLRMGSEAKIIRSGCRGPVILCSGDTRIAIGCGMSSKIVVQPIF